MLVGAENSKHASHMIISIITIYRGAAHMNSDHVELFLPPLYLQFGTSCIKDKTIKAFQNRGNNT